MYKLFGWLAVILITTSLVTEWIPLFEARRAESPVVAQMKESAREPAARHLDGMIAERETLSQVPKKLYKRSAPVPMSPTPAAPEPLHKTEGFEVVSSWMGVVGNFAQTAASLFSGLISLCLWLRSRKEKKAVA